MKPIVVTVCLAALGGCSGNFKEKLVEKVYIFQRKMLPGNKLQVSYTWQKGNTVVSDSSVLDNQALPQDSIPLSLVAKR